MSEATLKGLSSKRRVLARQMIDLIAEDDTFRGLILDDPIAAMEHAGMADAHDDLVDEFFEVKIDEDAEVSGFASFNLGVAKIGELKTPDLKGGSFGPRPQPTWLVAPSCSFPTSGSNCN